MVLLGVESWEFGGGSCPEVQGSKCLFSCHHQQGYHLWDLRKHHTGRSWAGFTVRRIGPSHPWKDRIMARWGKQLVKSSWSVTYYITHCWVHTQSLCWCVHVCRCGMCGLCKRKAHWQVSSLQDFTSSPQTSAEPTLYIVHLNACWLISSSEFIILYSIVQTELATILYVALKVPVPLVLENGFCVTLEKPSILMFAKVHSHFKHTP